jgi:exonuclease SbcD
LLKIFHTGDNHIGLKFNKYTGAKETLIEARFTTLEKMVCHANEKKCDLFVVAGDLFDMLSVKKDDICRVARILNLFSGSYGDDPERQVGDDRNERRPYVE